MFKRILILTSLIFAVTLSAQIVTETPIKDNLIVNGSMRVAQRGTSFAAMAINTYTLDRWQYAKVGDMVHTATQDTDVPTLAQSGITTQYSLKIDCTTADTSIAAGDAAYIMQKIEGYNIAPYVGRNLTLSFWVKSTKTGTYCIAFENSGIDRSYIAEYTINATNTWEKKIITIPLNFSGGTWNYTNGIGAYLYFVITSGSNYQGTVNTWNTINVIATSSQVNACDSTDNNFWLTNVKLEPGSVATKFEPRRFDDELRLCKRYFQKSYAATVAPGTNTALGEIYVYEMQTGAVFGGFSFPVEMRATPNTVTIYDTAGNSGYCEDGYGTQTAVTAIGDKSPRGIRYLTTGSTSSNISRLLQYAADAEL